jgi:hypothetical protein
MAGLLSYRRVKHGRPAKMKVLSEDLPRASWLDRLTSSQFITLVSAGALVAVIVGSSAGNPENTRAVQQQMSALASAIADKWSEAAPREKPSPVEKKPQSITRPKVIEIARSKSSGCHPSYSPCVPIISDVDCDGGEGNGPAFTGRVQVIGSDVYGLDRDGDGIGCE